MSTRRTIKHRYLKTKMALSQTIQSILEINRKRRFVPDDLQSKQRLQEELKVLNAVAENHARALANYERQIQRGDAEMLAMSTRKLTPPPQLPSVAS